MSGIIPTFQNIGVLIASLYPIFIIMFLFVASIFNSRINGLIYLFGILITFGLCWGFANLPLGDTRVMGSPVTCDFFSTFGYNYPSPNFQAAINSFTLIYLLIPMMMNKNLFNPLVIISIIVFSAINSTYLYLKMCTNSQGLILGTLIGGLFGFIWFSIMYSANKNLVFYNELASNNAICSMPSKQTFKCNVYKNGEIISSNVTG